MEFRRTPGQGRYAYLEREQRWLLTGLPSGVAAPVRITDRYLTATRLRVRRMEAGPEVVYKLAQKVRPQPDSPAEVKLTNLYLSQQEYELLWRLPGHDLHKTRWRWQVGDRKVAVDEFGGGLSGLVLAEVELAPGEGPVSLPPPAREVTDDDRFSGGRLAASGPAEVAALLAPPRPGPSGGCPTAARSSYPPRW